MHPAKLGAALLLVLAAFPLLPAASAQADDAAPADPLGSGCTIHIFENWWIFYVNCGKVPARCVDLIVAYACTKEIDTETGIGCGPFIFCAPPEDD